jgi:glutamine phosphoribosylpyrophosphate amidotransferase
MCEISFTYALESNLSEEEMDGMLRMMLCGSTHNDDGWGMFTSNGKFAKSPDEFSIDAGKNMKKVCNGASNFAVGHVRMATHGAKTGENTHPIIFKDIMLVHNGVIANEMALRQKFHIPRSPQVDSYVIAWLLNHFSHKLNDWEEVVKSVTKEIEGSYSVFFYVKSEKRLFYFRKTADFFLKLVEKDGKHFIVGNTDKDRIAMIYKESKYGFTMTTARTLSYLHPQESTLYEFTESGVNALCELPSPIEAPTIAFRFGYMNRFVVDDDICAESYGKK